MAVWISSSFTLAWWCASYSNANRCWLVFILTVSFSAYISKIFIERIKNDKLLRISLETFDFSSSTECCIPISRFPKFPTPIGYFFQFPFDFQFIRFKRKNFSFFLLEAWLSIVELIGRQKTSNDDVKLFDIVNLFMSNFPLGRFERSRVLPLLLSIR